MEIGKLLSGALARNPNTGKLTDDQRASLDKILAQFNPATFGQAEFNKLSADLNEAGIRPSAEVKKTIEAAGIDVSPYVKQLGNGQPSGSKGALPPPPPPPPPPKSSDSSDSSTIEELLTAIADFLEKLQSGSATEADTEELAALAQQAGAKGETGLIINQVA